MKDYAVTITLTVKIEARDEEQAQERAKLLAYNVTLLPAPNRARPWWPDMETPDVEVEEA